MALRPDICKDVMNVIANGTSEARVPAANLLFHYWPMLNPNIIERKVIQYKPHGWSLVRRMIYALFQPGLPPAASIAIARRI